MVDPEGNPQKGLRFALVAQNSILAQPTPGFSQVVSDKLLIETQFGDAEGSPYTLKLKVSDLEGGTAETSVGDIVLETLSNLTYVVIFGVAEPKAEIEIVGDLAKRGSGDPP